MGSCACSVNQHLGGLHRSWRQFHIQALLLALGGDASIEVNAGACRELRSDDLKRARRRKRSASPYGGGRDARGLGQTAAEVAAQPWRWAAMVLDQQEIGRSDQSLDFDVVSGAAVEDVKSSAADEDVIAVAAEQGVGTGCLPGRCAPPSQQMVVCALATSPAIPLQKSPPSWSLTHFASTTPSSKRMRLCPSSLHFAAVLGTFRSVNAVF
jgi:hypothetical protein